MSLSVLHCLNIVAHRGMSSMHETVLADNRDQLSGPTLRVGPWTLDPGPWTLDRCHCPSVTLVDCP